MENINLSTIPQILTLIGKSEKDKKAAIDTIKSHLSLETEDITDYINYDFLNSLYLRVFPSIYIINLDNVSLDKQNSLLKITEECPQNCYILMLSSFKNLILPTILNRSIDVELHQYSFRELRDYALSLNLPFIDLIASISNSFDDIDEFKKFDLFKLENLCDTICKSIGKASLFNVLSISNKYIYFKEYEDGKYSLDVFVSMLMYSLFNGYKKENIGRLYLMYLEVLRFKQKMLNKNLFRQPIFENLLINLWDIGKEDSYGY